MRSLTRASWMAHSTLLLGGCVDMTPVYARDALGIGLMVLVLASWRSVGRQARR